MSKTLLQRYTANFVEKVQIFGFLPTSQKTRSFLVLDSFLSFVPSFGSASQSFVVDKPDATHCPSQEIFLLGSRQKSVLVSSFNHSLHYTVLNVKNLIKGRRFLSSLAHRPAWGNPRHRDGASSESLHAEEKMTNYLIWQQNNSDLCNADNLKAIAGWWSGLNQQEVVWQQRLISGSTGY